MSADETTPYVSKVGLKALTLSPLTETVGADYVGTLSNRTQGSTITLVSVTWTLDSANVTSAWIADGDNIRYPKAVAGTYNVLINESFPNAVNDNRQTSQSVAIP
ncbi:hypothetical protein [Methylobacterium iners]|uniref:Uncharacterized protein n=1 Tax=Methylobacterium iners TaxID=418707 RepID=A0ABQ4RZN5_9HYPH|nr:hypothetical protein [Methylobacterium iners]GJD95022.1 hypothetical protein OCOJLMKI_2231 [Methylobacterium iners]